MKIVLEPISHPETGKLVIEDNSSLIGRQQPPFGSLRSPFVTRLSRRHARIFTEQGGVYLIDLGSLNGTTLNGQPIRGKLVRLNSGDKICFAGEWTFKVNIQGDSPQQSRFSSIDFKLVPQRDGRPAQTIHIDQFPFLINEIADSSDGTEAIPHAHALILHRNGQFYLEDLGNAGGTFVTGSRLDSKTVPLQKGDLIGFGRHPTVYTVRIEEVEDNFDGDQTQPFIQAGENWKNRLAASEQTAQNRSITLLSTVPSVQSSWSQKASGSSTQPSLNRQTSETPAFAGAGSVGQARVFPAALPRVIQDRRSTLSGRMGLMMMMMMSVLLLLVALALYFSL